MILLIIYWAVLFLVLVIYSKPSKRFVEPIFPNDIHVVIPVKDEQKHSALIRQNINLFDQNQIKVTIVDDHSKQPVEEYLSTKNASFFHATQKGKYNAIAEWAGSIATSHLWIVDADMILDQKTINNFLHGFDKNKTLGFMSIVHPQPQKFWQYFVWMEQVLLQRAAWLSVQVGQPSISNAACTLISRKKYLEVFEGHPVNSGGDVLMTKKFKKRQQVMLPPKFNAKTEFLSSFYATMTQRKRWMNNQKHMRFSPGILAGYFFWFLLLFAAPVASILYAATCNIAYLATLIPLILVLGVFSRPFYSLRTMLSIILYIIFGWMYQCIQFILIIFGRS